MAKTFTNGENFGSVALGTITAHQGLNGYILYTY